MVKFLITITVQVFKNLKLIFRPHLEAFIVSEPEPEPEPEPEAEPEQRLPPGWN